MQTIVNSTNNNSNNNRKPTETVTSLPERQAEEPSSNVLTTETKKYSIDSTVRTVEALALALNEVIEDGSETVTNEEQELLLPKLPPSTDCEARETSSEEKEIIRDVVRTEEDSQGGTKVSLVN